MKDSEVYDCLLELVRKRRTVRQFKPDPVPDGYVEKIIEVVRWAPSGFHTQPWEFVVVKEKTVKDAIVAAIDRRSPPITNPARNDGTPSSPPRPSFRDAPVFIFLLADWRARVGLPGHPAEINARVTSIYNSSLAGAFLYMHLAAASLGLASQWYSAASSPATERAIRGIIGIPESLTVYDMMVLGYPAASPGLKELRPFGEVVHYNDCGPQDFRTDEQVIAGAEKTYAWCMGEH